MFSVFEESLWANKIGVKHAITSETKIVKPFIKILNLKLNKPILAFTLLETIDFLLIQYFLNVSNLQ